MLCPFFLHQVTYWFTYFINFFTVLKNEHSVELFSSSAGVLFLHSFISFLRIDFFPLLFLKIYFIVLLTSRVEYLMHLFFSLLFSDVKLRMLIKRNKTSNLIRTVSGG